MAKAVEDLRKLGTGDGRPADDTANHWKFVSEVQEGLCLFQRLPCLNGDAALDSGRGQLLLKILRKKISSDRRHVPGDPAVFHFRIAPEMVVAVNSVGNCFQA